jgi:UDPglucose 6-dehydrogenase
MNIAIIGTGYVGLVSGVCLASIGHKVICVDVDEKKINNLKNNIIPIYEPGLKELMEKHINNISFSTSLSSIINDVDVVFCAVGTPMDEDGSADLKYVLAVADEFARSISKYTVFVTKSTVPVGTHKKIKNVVNKVFKELNKDIKYDVVSNPEFLKEGSAIDDFIKPDRIVIGYESNEAKEIMHNIYNDYANKIFYTDLPTAEMIKYASNSMLATRISFMNELSNLCDKVGANIEDVAIGMGQDVRIGPKFLNAGCGYGGSCFPKDVKALIQTGKENNIQLSILENVESANYKQKQIIINKFKETFKDQFYSKLNVAVWGLSFKPNTDDIREATSLTVIDWLKDNVKNINLYDPIVKEFPIKSENINICDDKYEALINADCLIIITEWDEFKNPNFNMIKDYMNGNTIIDGRNIYRLNEIENTNLNYISIGRQKITK